jgi:hypothetical protein
MRVHDYLHANANAGFSEATRFGAVTLYAGTVRDQAMNVVLAHDDDPAALAAALAEIRERVQTRGGRATVRLIAERFPDLATALRPLGFHETRREPMMTCTREQLRPVETPAGLSFETLTRRSSLEAIRL